VIASCVLLEQYRFSGDLHDGVQHGGADIAIDRTGRLTNSRPKCGILKQLH